MILFICAQDLNFFWLGLIKNQSLEVLEKVDSSPENILKSLDEFLRSHKFDVDQLKGVSVVSGPGSFTASRISLIIANGLCFTKTIPLFVLENQFNLTPKDLVRDKGVGEVDKRFEKTSQK
ncbi:hypothetical protein HY771_01335 [Candidatus Uhrbacteria bacterium]|nr:hypothetical protein [Candidatus Uhrbacteria bacterium]